MKVGDPVTSMVCSECNHDQLVCIRYKRMSFVTEYVLAKCKKCQAVMTIFIDKLPANETP